MSANIILQTKNLKKYYGKGGSQVHALDGVNLEIEAGKFVSIIGTSGSGKSTLLNMLGGLDTPTSGTVTIGNTELSGLKEEQLTTFRRRRIGFIFQNYNLIPTLNVWENIVFPIAMDGQKPDKRFIEEIVGLLGLEQKLHSLPNALSGGQQQRVAIARALASKPDIILADEPTGNLDSRSSQDVMDLLLKASRHYQQTVLMITHNMQLTSSVDRVFRVRDGQLQDLGGMQP